MTLLQPVKCQILRNAYIWLFSACLTCFCRYAAPVVIDESNHKFLVVISMNPLKILTFMESSIKQQIGLFNSFAESLKYVKTYLQNDNELRINQSKC